MTNATAVLCYNGCELTPEEADGAYLAGGEVACFGCYEEWRFDNEEKCPLCEDYWEEHDMSDCFILADISFAEPGLYRAVRFPFYSQPVIGMPHLYPDAVERIGSLLPGANFDMGCPAAFVCNQCMRSENGDG